MKFVGIAVSDVGRNRQNNEDNLYFNHECRIPSEAQTKFSTQLTEGSSACLFAVCDGMGGEALGEQASFIAASGLKVLEDRLSQAGITAFPKLMQHYILRTNETMCQYIRQNEGLRMGATFTALMVYQGVLQAINIGDTMAYLFRNRQLYPLTTRHNHAQRLVDMEVITAEEAERHPERHRLTQHLGLFAEERALQPSLSPQIILQAGDKILICSDGITDMLSLEQIRTALLSDHALNHQANQILEEALQMGGKDNATLIMLEIQETAANQAAFPQAVLKPPFVLTAMPPKTLTQAKPESQTIRPAAAATPSAVLADPAAAPSNQVLKSAALAGVRRLDPATVSTQPQPTAAEALADKPDLRPAHIPVAPDPENRAAASPFSPPVAGATGSKTAEFRAIRPKVHRIPDPTRYQLTDDEWERFNKAKADAKLRQQAKQQDADVDVEISTAMDDDRKKMNKKNNRGKRDAVYAQKKTDIPDYYDQPYVNPNAAPYPPASASAGEAANPQYRGPATPGPATAAPAPLIYRPYTTWDRIRHFLGHLIFLILFALLGYGLAWITMNLGNIKQFLDGLLA
ncbi:MAG: protein phosphatase 2C domain-containing protein [Oscillospiraceae bacterium]|nr:protein phosphatase 2C domain-containing protein [Oscillospiraceae bacterium]